MCANRECGAQRCLYGAGHRRGDCGKGSDGKTGQMRNRIRGKQIIAERSDIENKQLLHTGKRRD